MTDLKKPPRVTVTGKNPGLLLTEQMWLDTTDRIEYVPGCILIFAFFNARYILIDRDPKGEPQSKSANKPVKLLLVRDRRTREQFRQAQRLPKK